MRKRRKISDVLAKSKRELERLLVVPPSEYIYWGDYDESDSAKVEKLIDEQNEFIAKLENILSTLGDVQIPISDMELGQVSEPHRSLFLGCGFWCRPEYKYEYDDYDGMYYIQVIEG